MANAGGSAARKKNSRKVNDAQKSEQGVAENVSSSTVGASSAQSSAKTPSGASALSKVSTGVTGLWDKTVRYLKSVKTEMGRVTWPSTKELRAATIVVVVTLVIVAAYMGVVDQLLTLVFRTPVATGY